MTEHLTQWRNKFEDAQDIVLAGGGSVGIETAGEIKDIWPVSIMIVSQFRSRNSDPAILEQECDYCS